ncbi:MAG: EamA family transporter [Clostridia bacterium]|nr:EamA family transporter [Clostridia bacterium]
MDPKRLGMIQIIICSVLWSTGGIFIKLIPWNAMALSGARSLIAALVVLVSIKVMRLELKLSKRTVSIAVSLAGTLLMFVLSTKLTTAANAIVLQYCAPVLILLYYAIFKKKRFLKTDYIVVLLTLGGIVLFFLDGLSSGSVIGNVTGLFGGIFFSGVFINSAEADESTRFSGIFQGQLLTAVIGLPFAAALNVPITGQTLILIILLGIFQLGLPYAIYAVALKNCPPLTASLIAILEPLLNPLWVFIFAGETPGMWSLIGAVIVLASVTFWCAKDAAKKSA